MCTHTHTHTYGIFILNATRLLNHYYYIPAQDFLYMNKTQFIQFEIIVGNMHFYNKICTNKSMKNTYSNIKKKKKTFMTMYVKTKQMRLFRFF